MRVRKNVAEYGLLGLTSELAQVLDKGLLDANTRAADGTSLLHNAAYRNRLETAALLISKGADINQGNDIGYTPLMAAAREGFVDMVKLLIDHGANVNAATTNLGDTALTLAITYSPPNEIVDLLIQRRANVNHVTLTGSSPLTQAAWTGNAHAVRLLLERGADPKFTNKKGKTALDNATDKGHEEVARIIKEHLAHA